MRPAPRAAPDLDLLVRTEQLRQHRLILPAAVASSALLGLMVAIVQSRITGAASAAAWLIALALVLGARFGVAMRRERAEPDHRQLRVWLGRYRLMSLAHGVVWAAGCVVLFPATDVSHQLFLSFALAGLCVSSLSGYSFDLRAALSFCLPVLLAMLTRLLMLGTDPGIMMSAFVVLFIAYMLAIARRANRTMRDAVALRGAQAAQLADVHRSHMQLQRAEALADLGSFVFDCARASLRWSDGHFRVWGLEPGSVTPDRAVFLAGVHPDDRERVDLHLQRAIDAGTVSDCRYRVCWPDGSVRHVLGRSEVQRDAQGQVLAVTGTVQDVTHQTFTEASLVEKQQLLSVMQQTTQLGFWFVGPDGRTTGVNPAVRIMLAWPDDRLHGHAILDCVDSAYARRLRLALSGADVSGQPATLVEVRRADASVVHCLAHEATLVDSSGRVTGLLVMLSDLSAVERARAAQHVSEFIVNSVHDMVSMTDLDGRYQFVNDAWCRRHRMQREQVLGRTIVEVLPDSMAQRRTEALRRCIDKRALQVVRLDLDFPGLGRRVMEATMTPYFTSDTQVRGVVAVIRDVTETEATRAALAQSLENLQRIFNATADGLCAHDAAHPMGQLLFANDKFFDMWHMAVHPGRPPTRDEILDASSKMFVDPPREFARIEAILAMDTPHTDRLVLRDGRVFERRSVPMRNDSGPTRVWTFRDITLQEQAADAMRANEGQQRALMDAFPGYVSVIDQDFIYTYANPRMAELFGRTVDEIVGHHMRDLLGESNYRKNTEVMKRVQAGERVTIERLHDATAERPAIYQQMTLVRGAKGSGGLQRYYAFGIDITELKRAELALRAAKEDAERADRAKSAFLASVSHELRTPLNAILGFSQLLRTDARVSPTVSDNAGEIERAGRHLLSLVDDLIDLGGVEAGRLELTMARLTVETVINEALSMVAPLAANQGIRIVFEGGDARNAVVLADAVRLRQVVINLLSNAIKYNRTDGSVRVSCRHRQPDGDQHGASIRIAIADTGEGIAPEMASRVFSPFERLGAERGAVEGTGIGLSISRRLVSAMGGSIGYASRLHEGSTFWIDLPPLTPAATDDAAAQATASPRAAQLLLQRGARPRILVAEDYGPNQAVLLQQLSSLGCNVDIVSDGVEALAHRDAAVCDLILTDLDMPRMGGHELARAIRLQETQGASRIPIIAISAAVAAGERERCIAAGMDDMLTKPISLEALHAMLARWLGAGAAPDARLPAPVKPEPPATATAAAVLDLDALYAVLGRVSSTQAGKLLATFLDTAAEGLRQLARAEPDPAALAREMHRQQSSARTVGALRYAQMAQSIEQGAPSQGPAGLAQSLQSLGEALQQVRASAATLGAMEPTSMPAPLQAESATHELVGSVLIVDDDPVVRMQMQQMLTGLGIGDVLTARNGVDALHQVERRQDPPDVVVCDLNMPEMDGVEMIRRFGQSGLRASLILMSGADEQLMATVGNLAELQGLRVLGEVHKPATPQQMRALLQAPMARPMARLPIGGPSVLTPQALLAGIAHAEFSVVFQPIVRADTLAPVGVEALARWQQADGTRVPPDLFIVAAERAGIIGQLSAALLEAALRDGARLHRAGFRLTIALNLSALWLDDLQLPDLLLQTALAQGLQPADIQLEVTETGVTKDIATALDVLTRLRLKGFGLSIDDFGIGYSSFEQLGRIPFTELKLDRSFVARGTRDAAARAILESSMAMATKLSLRTVAEGVETAQELALVRQLGCDALQGFLIAQPMPADELIAWLHARAA